MAGPNIEVEWQLEATDLSVVQRWIEHAAVADGVSITSGPVVNHVDTYLDTKDRRLDRAGYSVRVRRSPGRTPQVTLKSLERARGNAPRRRRELEEQLELTDPAALAMTSGVVGPRVRALVGPNDLVPLFDLETERSIFPLAVAGVRSGELSLDDTAIRESRGRILSRLRRVEVEVPESVLDAVGPLVERMRRACGLEAAVLSKYEAGLAASGSSRVEPEQLGSTDIVPTDPIGKVALAVLRRQFAKLLAKEPGARLGDDVEDLHDMRVASRRLRAAVSLFRDALPIEADRLRPELAWVGRTVGAVRDLDVQLAKLDELSAALPLADREGLKRLRALLVAEREVARAEMIQAFDSARYERFVRRFGAMLRQRTGSRTSPALAAAPDLVEHRHRGLRKARSRIAGDGDPAAYHRLRIAGKRFRYALEFLSEVYPGETERLIARTVALQDLLGAHQDAHVGIARLRALATERGTELGPEAVFAMGEVAERYLAGTDDTAAGVDRAYAQLDGKAWKRLKKRMAAARPREGVDAVATGARHV